MLRICCFFAILYLECAKIKNEFEECSMCCVEAFSKKIIHFSAEEVHSRLVHGKLPVDGTNGGNKTWMIELFIVLSAGVHLAQVDLKEGTSTTEHHIAAVAIVKEWKRCVLPDDRAATMQDNRREAGIVWKKDADEANMPHTGE